MSVKETLIVGDDDFNPAGEFMKKAISYWEAHSRLVTFVLVVLVLVVLGLAAKQHFREQHLDRASAAYSATYKLSGDKKVESLASVVTDFEGTVFAAYASFELGQKALLNNDPSAAIEWFRGTLGVRDLVPSVRVEVYEGIGVAEEMLGNVDEARAAYRSALSVGSAYRRAAVSYKLALLYVSQDNHSEAIKLLGYIAEDNAAPDYIKSRAEHLLAEIK